MLHRHWISVLRVAGLWHVAIRHALLDRKRHRYMSVVAVWSPVIGTTLKV